MSVALLRQIRSFPDVRIDTGNIHRHVDVLRRVSTDPVDELLASLESQLQCATIPNVTYGPDMVILAPETEYTFSDENAHFDLKITLKIFMPDWDQRHIVDCVDTALQQLGVRAITQLIICFPDDDETDTDEKLSSWLQKALPVWRQLEELVNDGRVTSLGVADLSTERLIALNEAPIRVRLSINHHNVEGCCALPQDLREYASENNILILTHNDPHLGELREKVAEKTAAYLGDDRLFELGWCARNDYEFFFAFRYTAWAQSRSLVCSKGYLLQFKKNEF
ncbi:unnamed protein product [Enterobius vermicularis]|uniref:GCS light chain n=1 Tax=Enterobius vermicularis TaxID=51028 RepID=A0A0N4V1T2_ENTVE|nr:unnamed protein product [Enterobius vermicularis]